MFSTFSSLYALPACCRPRHITSVQSAGRIACCVLAVPLHLWQLPSPPHRPARSTNPHASSSSTRTLHPSSIGGLSRDNGSSPTSLNVSSSLSCSFSPLQRRWPSRRTSASCSNASSAPSNPIADCSPLAAPPMDSASRTPVRRSPRRDARQAADRPTPHRHGLVLSH